MHDFEMGERRATLNKVASLLRKVLSKTITPQAGPTAFGKTRRRTSRVPFSHYATTLWAE